MLLFNIAKLNRFNIPNLNYLVQSKVYSPIRQCQTNGSNNLIDTKVISLEMKMFETQKINEGRFTEINDKLKILDQILDQMRQDAAERLKNYKLISTSIMTSGSLIFIAIVNYQMFLR